MAAQPKRLVGAHHEDLLFALGQRDHHWRADFQGGKRGQRGAELTFAAVDQENIGKDPAFVIQALEPPGDHLVDAGRIVHALDRANPVSLVARLERQPVDELHQAGHGLAAGQVGDVDPLDGPRRPGQTEHLL